LGVLALTLDQWSKALVQQHIGPQDAVVLLPVLELVHTHNTGVAFSFMAGGGGWQRWAFTVFGLAMSIVLLVWLRRSRNAGQRLQCAGFMLIVSGALGNVIDRIRHGYVVDFILAHWQDALFPVFNVADSCITIGAGLFLLDALLESRREARVRLGKVD
jgi:signal peptidase II